MSVLNPEEEELFRVTITKALQNNPSETWVNTYEVMAPFVVGEPISVAELTEVAEKILEWERSLHLTSILFTRYVVSTWLSDSEPYNGDEFIAVPLNMSGTVLAAGDVLSLEQCLYIQRVPIGGRTGKLYLRGCLQEDQVEAPAGRSTLTPSYLASLETALTSGGSAQNLPEVIANTSRFELRMFGRNGTGGVTNRRVTTLVPSDRVVNKKLDNRFFNRTSQAGA